jgi:hypothetical protein
LTGFDSLTSFHVVDTATQLGQPAFASRVAFIEAQFVTPPLPEVKTLETFFACDKVAWRWNASGIGSNRFEVKGMITFDVNTTTQQMTVLYSEFNTAAFQADLGYPECSRK